jgi:hypothetical protein
MEGEMNRKHLRTGILRAGLVTLALASAARDNRRPRSGPVTSSPIGSASMKLNGASWADAQAKLKAGTRGG